MRQIRIYQPGILQAGQTLQLTEEAAHHVSVVLRMQAGDKLIVFCGDNREFEACIDTIQKKKTSIFIQSEKIVNKESPLRIHLVQSIAKGDKMEWVVQKAVELGAASIQPIISAHCAVKSDKLRLQKKWQQWRAIAIAACEQCGRNQIPELMPIIDLEEYLFIKKPGMGLIMHPEGNKHLKDYFIVESDVKVMVGPEGGFSDAEVQKSFQAGFLPWQLGPRILRTETAAIAALSLLQAAKGDL